MDNPGTETSGDQGGQQGAESGQQAPERSFEALLGVEAPQPAGDPQQADAKPAQSTVEPAADDGGELFTVKVDGQEIQVSRDELLRGYSRQADYSRKTAELAQQRQQAEKAVAAIHGERQQQHALLAQLTQALGQQLQGQANIDWNALLETNPQEYLKQRHLFEQRQAALQQARAVQQRQQLEAQQTQAQQHQQFLQDQHRALLDKLPDWKDPAKAAEEQSALVKYLAKEGYRPEEIDGVADSRAVLMARKAMLYDQMQTQAAEASKRVQHLPPRVVRPGVSQTGPADGRTQAMRELAKSGTTDNAARVFEGFLR